MGCVTATVSMASILIICLLPINIRNIITDRRVVVVALISSALILLVFESILQINFINELVSGFFNKTYTITGRLKLYNNYLGNVILNKFWLGYGYNNGKMMQVTGVFANAQNGLLEQLVNYGLIGTCSLVFTVYYCFRKAIKANSVFYLCLVVYGMIVASVVEISINWFFLLGICLVRWNKYRE
jgi:O-antigen ligase